MLKVAITGSTGLIGSRMVKLLKDKIAFIPLTQADMNITDTGSVEKAISGIDFDVFLHLAGYTNVDQAEKTPGSAIALNVDGTRNVFNAVEAKNKKFVYISTDFVFDGQSPPYNEESQPHPISVYGQTKYDGENLVSGKAMIIRPSYPYRKEFEAKKDFVRTIKSLLEQKKPLTMVHDSLITPTFIDDMVQATGYLLEHFSPETFHIVGSDSMSPYAAGKLIAKTFSLDSSLISPVSYNEYFKDKAKRPRYSDIKSIKNTFYQMKPFEDGLKAILS